MFSETASTILLHLFIGELCSSLDPTPHVDILVRAVRPCAIRLGDEARRFLLLSKFADGSQQIIDGFFSCLYVDNKPRSEDFDGILEIGSLLRNLCVIETQGCRVIENLILIISVDGRH